MYNCKEDNFVNDKDVKNKIKKDSKQLDITRSYPYALVYTAII